jgi:nicotinamidase-related amidase
MTTALVVIDVQQGMFAFPDYPPHDGEGVVARIAGLIARARAAERPIFYVQHDGGPGHPLGAGTEGFPFRPELAPQPGDSVTVKRNCNSFQDTDLDARLRNAGIDHLVICGMQTEFCVDTAVRAGFERGYKITLVEDAHSTGDTPVLKAKDIVAHHNRTLADFAKLQCANAIAFAD